MHFNITLTSNETYEENYSYGMVFIPNAVFVKGDEKVLIPDTQTPYYKLGYFKELLKKEPKLLNLKTQKKAHILIEEIGHGTFKDLETLKSDLEDCSFIVSLSSM